MKGAIFSVDFAALELAEALRAKLFDGEAAEDRAVHHGAAQRCIVRTATTGQVAHEAAGEGIACSCRIMRLLQRKRRYAEDAALVHHHGAIFTAFDDQSRGTELENVAGGEQ